MMEYIQKIQKLFVTEYGFQPREDAPNIPKHVPDGIYPMEINGKTDWVRIEEERIHCGNLEKDKS